MAQLIEVPELESWFLVDWREFERPAVLMEFDSKEHAEDALCAAFAEVTTRPDEEVDPLPIMVCPTLTMLENPVLQRALAIWDAQQVELDVTLQRAIDELR